MLQIFTESCNKLNAVFFTERFFQSSVITSEATAMDTTSVGQSVGVDTDDIAPDKAPDLRSP